MENRSMVKGDICLAKFPFGGKVGVKIRPVLLLTGPVGSVPEFLAAYISSIIPATLLPSDLLLDPHSGPCAATKLKTVSVLRLHKLATIHQSDAIRRLGQLPPASCLEVETRLRTLLKL
jgi:mRNA-degrading endonuclease toxin of MazEF toxin-antitoxin module